MRVYKEITFAEDMNLSFAEFKDSFSSNWVFNLPEKEKEQELKKAYKIATDGNIRGTAEEIKQIESKKTIKGSI